MSDINYNERRERILDSAEELFTKRGYKAVKLRDIAEVVGMRHASLYYYIPKGKEQLYVEVMKRYFAKHNKGIAQAIADAGGDIEVQVHAMAQWFVNNPPLDLARMQQADLPALSSENAQLLTDLAIDSLTLPIIEALQQAVEAERLQIESVGLASMALIALMQSIQNIPSQHLPNGLKPFGRQLADMLLFGWLKR